MMEVKARANFYCPIEGGGTYGIGIWNKHPAGVEDGGFTLK